MARGKKKENLSLEEKLEAALVPEDEQPYEVPGNWCWTRLGTLIELHRGVSYQKNDTHTEKQDDDCLILRGGNINEGSLDLEADNVYVSRKLVGDNQIIKANDVVIIGSTGSTKVIGRAGIADADYNDVAFGAFLMLARPILACNARFIDYIFQSDLYRSRIRTLASGVNINNIKAEYITNIAIPFPPLAEQHRIVERIESLFSQLDEARDKAQEALNDYDVRIKAVLSKALFGEYTKKWREKHGISKDSWQIKKIADVCTPRAGYAFDSKKFISSGYQIIRMGNLYNGFLDLSRSPVFISPNDVDDATLKRAKTHDGDILITLTGTKYKRDYGYAVCIEGEQNLLVNQRILCLSPKDGVNKDFLLFYLRSEVFRDIFFSKETGGVNQGNVSSKFVENIEIHVPLFEEQTEIAKYLNDVLNQEMQVKESIEILIDQINIVKKSILAKAFRGELGTNAPEDESAIELLKSILEDTKEVK